MMKMSSKWKKQILKKLSQGWTTCQCVKFDDINGSNVDLCLLEPKKPQCWLKKCASNVLWYDHDISHI